VRLNLCPTTSFWKPPEQATKPHLPRSSIVIAIRLQILFTFVRVYRAAERYHAGYAFSTYIYRIASNLAISELRKRKRRRLISLTGLFQPHTEEGENTEFQPTDEKPLQDAALADEQIKEIVAKAIATLPENYRAPLILRDVEGKSYEEIARILDANEGTIKSRISRGRNLLRDKLKNYF